MPEDTTKAILDAEGRTLIEQPDGSYRRAASKSDWERVDALSEEEIEAAAAADPHGVGSEDDWLKMTPAVPPAKELFSIRLDSDVLEWFRRQGRGYQTRINAVLRAYKEAHEQRSGSRTR